MIQKAAESMLAAIGNTPLIKLDRLTRGLSGTIFAKLEFFSPGLSKKDRVELKMLPNRRHGCWHQRSASLRVFPAAQTQPRP